MMGLEVLRDGADLVVHGIEFPCLCRRVLRQVLTS